MQHNEPLSPPRSERDRADHRVGPSSRPWTAAFCGGGGAGQPRVAGSGHELSGEAAGDLGGAARARCRAGAPFEASRPSTIALHTRANRIRLPRALREAGNTVLVGHNFGYDANGVFVRLGRLKAGQKIYVVSNKGDTFLYEVDSVKRIKWRRKNLEELLQHSKYLSPDGPERLTLVTCGGANIEPFPDRIYVVAYPASPPPLPSNQLSGLR